MAIREIPKSYEYSCDACGIKHLQEDTAGYYPGSTPPFWGKVWKKGDQESVYIVLLCCVCYPAMGKLIYQFVKAKQER